MKVQYSDSEPVKVQAILLHDAFSDDLCPWLFEELEDMGYAHGVILASSDGVEFWLNGYMDMSTLPDDLPCAMLWWDDDERLWLFGSLEADDEVELA